jgi:CheY-like chemotaxis protein
LIVDDEQEILDMLVEVLSILGYQSTGVQSAEQALAVCATTPVDLVITDVVMPGMNGLELLRILKQQRPALPVVIIAAFSAPEEVREMLAVGAAGVLAKPFEISAIEPLLTRVLSAIPGR